MKIEFMKEKDGVVIRKWCFTIGGNNTRGENEAKKQKTKKASRVEGERTRAEINDDIEMEIIMSYNGTAESLKKYV